MQRTSWSTLGIIAVGTAGGSYIVLGALESSGTIVPVSGLSWLAILLIAVVVLMLGLSVRRLTEGKSTRLDAIRAARVAMLAKASSLAGTALAGYHGAQTLIAWTNISAPALRDHAVVAGAAAVACVVLVAVGMLVEHWCRLPPPDEGEPA